jgi:hypothetical protein
MEELLKTIAKCIPNTYQVLEGDHEVVYVRNKETDKHFAIHVSECNDD